MHFACRGTPNADSCDALRSQFFFDVGWSGRSKRPGRPRPEGPRKGRAAKYAEDWRCRRADRASRTGMDANRWVVPPSGWGRRTRLSDIFRDPGLLAGGSGRLAGRSLPGPGEGIGQVAPELELVGPPEPLDDLAGRVLAASGGVGEGEVIGRAAHQADVRGVLVVRPVRIGASVAAGKELLPEALEPFESFLGGAGIIAPGRGTE